MFFLHGEDEYRKGVAARELASLYLDEATRDFNFDRLEAAATSPERLASLIATPPMMAEWRIAWIQGVEGVAGIPSVRKVLLDAARNPPPGLALILTATVPRKSRAAFYRDMIRACASLEFRPLPDEAAPAWLVEWARETLGSTLELEAARALTGAVGADLGVLTQEVRKLAEMVDDGAPVDLEAVRQGGIRLPRQDRWEWFDLVGSRRVREAVRALPVLLEQGETAIGLVVGLSTQLLRIGVALEGGAAALNGALPAYQRFLAQRIMGQSRAWTRAEVAEAVRGLAALDWRLKTGSTPGDVQMEAWLWGLARTGRARSGARR